MNSTPQQTWWSFTHNALLTQGVVLSPSFLSVFSPDNELLGHYPHTYVPRNIQTLQVAPSPRLTSILDLHDSHTPQARNPMLLVLHSALYQEHHNGEREIEVGELSRRFRLALIDGKIFETCGLTPWVVVRGSHDSKSDSLAEHYTLLSLAVEPQLGYALRLYRDGFRLSRVRYIKQYLEDMAVVHYH